MSDAISTPVQPRHLSSDELEAGRSWVLESPLDDGVVDMIIRRPAVEEREILAEAELSSTYGVVGDNWIERGSSRTEDGSSHPDMQLNVINSRVARLVAGDAEDARALAGDQLHVDLRLNPENLPAGTRLAIGNAVIEVTDQPHTGCAKFASRFGAEALRFVNTGGGKAERFRGLNAKVVVEGTIRPGDRIRKLTS